MGGLLILKFSFACSLFVCFLIIFGVPSIEKFQAKQTILVETYKKFKDVDNPTITICSNQGWKSNHAKNSYVGLFQTNCQNSNNTKEALECINRNMYNLSDMVITALDGNKRVVNQEYWNDSISWLGAGRCQTLNASAVHIGTDMDEPMSITFNTSLDTYTMVHDQDFFVLGPNPLTMPRIMTIQTKNFGRQLMYIQTIEHVKMNLPNKPCEVSPTYSLSRCISNTISQKIGCRPEWDRLSDQERQVCTDTEQLINNDDEFYKLSGLEQRDIPSQTGCLLPCIYKEYQVVDEPLTMGMDSSSLNLVRATKTVLIITEVLVYPFSSFLAEFGGALGLFIGFSFMMVWDFLQVVSNIIWAKRKMYCQTCIV